MGTKNNPGTFDCYANAEGDEPMFVLLGRDKHAPTLVWLWPHCASWMARTLPKSPRLALVRPI